MILLSGGTIIDGPGQPARRGDVLVRDGKIAEVGTIAPSPGMDVIECSGLAVTPRIYRRTQSLRPGGPGASCGEDPAGCDYGGGG